MKSLTSDAELLNVQVSDALQDVENSLKNLATSPDLLTKMQGTFGDRLDGEKARVLATSWAAGDFSTFPAIEIRDSAEINGARGAFAQTTGKIYLSRELVNGGDVGAIGSVLLEEYGHYIDAQINREDAPGDEGALFAASVEGQPLNESDILTLKAEDDSAVVVLDGQEVSIEQQVQSDTLDFFANDIPFKGFLGGTQSLLDDFLEKKKLTLPISAGPGRATIPLAGGGAGLVANVGFDYNVQGSIALFPFVQLGDNLGKVSRLSYPINIDAELPNAVSHNETFSIKTPYQVGKAEISGLGVNLPDAGIKIKHGFENFNLSNFSFVNTPFGSLVQLPPEVNISSTGFKEQTATLASIKLASIEFKPSKDLGNKRDLGDFLKTSISRPEIKNFNSELISGDIGSLSGIKATSTDGKSFAKLSGDIDNAVASFVPAFAAEYALLKEDLKRIPGVDIKPKGLGVSVKIPPKDLGGDRGNLELSADLLDITGNLELGLEQSFIFKPNEVRVTMSVDKGLVDGSQQSEKSLEQTLAQPFQFTAPSEGSGVIKVKAKFNLLGELKNNIDALFQGNLGTEIVKGSLAINIGKLKTPKLPIIGSLELELPEELSGKHAGTFSLSDLLKIPKKTPNIKLMQLPLLGSDQEGLRKIESIEVDTIGQEDVTKNLEIEKTYEIPYNMPVTISDVTVDEGNNPPPGEGKAYFIYNGKYYEWESRSVELFTGPTGDVLSRIALQTLGDASSTAYDFIAFHNNIPNPDLIIAGSTIEVPKQVQEPDTKGYAVFNVTQSGTPSAPAKIKFNTVDGTANAGSDYLATTGNLSIPAAGSGVILVPIVGDEQKEKPPVENFTVVLTKQDGTPFADGVDKIEATGTIIDDDNPPEPPQPEKRLPSIGDPHLVTLDGLRYDFQSAGEFILLKSTSGDLEVQVRQEPISDSVSVNTAVATKIDDKRVAFYLNENQPLLIDGQPTNITEGSYINVGSGRIYREGTTYTVVLNSAGEQLVVESFGSRIDVNIFLAEGREEKVLGLGGNNNGKTDDDIALRDGTILSQPIAPEDLYGKYEDSWRISQAESLFDYKPGETTETFTNRLIPSKYVTIDDLDPADRQKAEQMALAAGITDPQILESAIIDLVFSNFDESYLQSAFNSKTASAALAVIIPPNATDDSANTTANTPVNIEVLLNDRGTIGVPLAINNFDATTTAGGTLQRDNNNTPDDTSDDKLTYTPPVNFTGTDSFNYTLTDGTETDTAKVTITVPEFNLSTLNGGNGFVLKDAEAGSFSGVSVSKIGDFNGDNIDDLIVGAFAADPNGSNAAGKSFVVFGTTAGFPADFDLSTLNGSNGFVLNGIDAESFSGGSVSSAGDINNDGFDDVIVGAFGAAVDGKNNAGKTYILFGSNAGFPTLNLSELNGSNGFVLNGTNEFDYLGLAVSSAGDINDDGFDDILVGVPGAAGGGSGKTYILFGRSQGFAPSLNLAEINGENGIAINNAAANAGISVSKAGDINSDGIADLIIGTEADPNSANTAGESYVVFGSSDKFPASLNLSELNGSNGFILNGIDKNSGTSVSSAGDINGDGIDDLMVAENAENALGKSYIVFGSNQGFSASLDLSKLDGKNGFLVFNGIDGNSITSVNTAGDMNGDSIDDIALGVSASTVNDKFAAGKTYIMFGNNGGFPAAINLSKLDGSNGFVLNGAEAEDLSGTSVSEAGDINNDGTDDLVIGSPGSLFNNTPGKSYAVFGSNNFGNDASNLAKILFNPGFYLKTNPDVAAAVESGETRSASEHFNEFGFEEGRVPSAIFADYLNQNPDVAAAVARGDISNGFEHFIKYGFAEGRLPNSEFSLLETFYLAQNPDVAESVKQGTFASGLEHLIRVGLAEGRNPLPSFNAISQTFNAEEYLAQNPDVAEAVNQGAFRNGFEHFVKVGLGEGRDPSSTFSNSVYLASYPDVAEAVNQGQFRNGFDHFMKAGFSEDRSGQAFTFAGFDGTFGAFEAFNIDPPTGSAETDILTGDGADNTLNGELTNDTLTDNSNVFALQPGGENQVITDFEDGIDFLGLANGVAFEQLAIAPGDGATLINLNGQPLASLTGVEASNISRDDFILI